MLTKSRNQQPTVTLAAVAVFALASVVALPAVAQPDLSGVEIRTETLADGLYVLFGAGGNIGVSVGDDGVLLIDDQYAPLTDKIRAAVGKITDQPIKFVLNTHWHGDHTGGNENLGKAGTLIVAHDNVRERMSSEQFLAAFNNRVPASPDAALPVVTFNDTVTFHLNGETLHAFHVSNAHTDGDSIVHFKEANVVHMGDTYFNGMYPFIDTSTGGGIDGMIATAAKVAGMIDDSTQVIPGHGPMSNKKELLAYHAMLESVRSSIAAQIAQGHDREATVAAKPTAAFDEQWGGGFIGPDVFAGIVFDSLSE